MTRSDNGFTVKIIDQTTQQDLAEIDWAARARELVPIISEAAERTEQGRCIPKDIIAAMHQAELYRMSLPRMFGGGEVHLLTLLEVLQIIAAADASTGWCLGQSLGCARAAAFLPPESAHEIFDAPDTIVCWGAANMTARAVVIEGGYQVTGDWFFGSGIDNATWVGGHIPLVESDGSPRLDPGGKPAIRTMLWPRDQTIITDVWQVIGLQGTGSNAYSVDDIFVPDHHVFIRDAASDRRVDSPLYRISLTQYYGVSFAGVALGIARPMLDDFIELARGKTARGTSRKLGENPAIQVQIAQAEARLGAARAYLVETIAEIWQTAETGIDFSLDQLARLRISSTHAINEARDVADFAYRAAGASAILKSNPFERRFRDINAVAQQTQGQPTNLEQAGQVFLGMDTPGNRL